MNLGDYKAGCAQRLFLKNRGQFRLCYDNLVLLSQFLVCLFFFGLSICYTEFCRVTRFVCVHASVRARARERALYLFERYGKRHYIYEGLWCSANHHPLGQSANQSRLCLSEAGAL